MKNLLAPPISLSAPVFLVLAAARYTAAALALAALAANPASAQTAKQEPPIVKAYCQYLFSIPDGESDAFEAAYAEIIRQSTARMMQSDKSMTYYQALLKIRKICTDILTHHVE